MGRASGNSTRRRVDPLTRLEFLCTRDTVNDGLSGDTRDVSYRAHGLAPPMRLPWGM